MAGYILPCDYQPITVIELVLDRNALGESYNMTADRCNWQCGTKSFWFSDCKAPPQIQAATGGAAIQSIITSYTPRCSVLDFSKGISSRARITVCFEDVPIDCSGATQGNFWSMLDAEQKYWENRKVIVYHGECTQTLDEMSREVYYIDSVQRSGNCQYCLTAKDPLGALSETVVPATCLPADQVLTLRDAFFKDIKETGEDSGIYTDPFQYVGAFILSQNYPQGDPVVDEWWRCINNICVDGEMMEVVAHPNDPATSGFLSPDQGFGPAGWNLVLIGRGVCGSELKDHERGASVTVAETFSNCHVADAVNRLLNMSKISDISLTCCDSEPDVTIDCQSIEDFRCKNPLAVIDSTIVCDGTNASKLLEELAAENFFTMQYDSESGQIKMVCLNPSDSQGEPVIVNECDIVEGSISYKSKTERYSRVDVLHKQIDCTKGITESNFGPGTYAIDTDTENPIICERVKYRTGKTKQVRSRWMGACGEYLARTYAERVLCLFESPREKMSFGVMPNVSCNMPVGSLMQFNHPKIQDAFGAPSQKNYVVTGKCRSGKRNACVTIHVEEMFDADSAPFEAFVCDADNPADNLTGGVEACLDCKPMW